MKLTILQFGILVLISFSTFAQSLSKKELQYLQSTVSIFLSSHEKLNGHKRSSEFIICLFSIDSAGAVNNIHLLADDKNRDSTWFYLSSITPGVFKDWKAINCKGKTIMMPVVSIGQGNSTGYIQALQKKYPLKEIDVENETEHLIIISALQYHTPVTKTDYEEIGQ